MNCMQKRLANIPKTRMLKKLKQLATNSKNRDVTQINAASWNEKRTTNWRLQQKHRNNITAKNFSSNNKNSFNNTKNDKTPLHVVSLCEMYKKTLHRKLLPCRQCSKKPAPQRWISNKSDTGKRNWESPGCSHMFELNPVRLLSGISPDRPEITKSNLLPPIQQVALQESTKTSTDVSRSNIIKKDSNTEITQNTINLNPKKQFMWHYKLRDQNEPKLKLGSTTEPLLKLKLRTNKCRVPTTPRIFIRKYKNLLLTRQRVTKETSLFLLSQWQLYTLRKCLWEMKTLKKSICHCPPM